MTRSWANATFLCGFDLGVLGHCPNPANYRISTSDKSGNRSITRVCKKHLKATLAKYKHDLKVEITKG